MMNTLGYNSQTWAMCQNQLELGKDTDKFIYHNKDNFFVKEIKKFLCLRYTFIFDIVFFNFGSTLYTPFASHRYKNEKGINFFRLFLYAKYRNFMQIVEIKLLQLFNVKIFVQYQGSDARQKRFCMENFENTLPQYKTLYTLKDHEIDTIKQQQIKIFDKISSKIYSLNPDLMYVLPKRTTFLPYCHISLDHWKPSIAKQNCNQVIRIAHAPSNREIKGTEIILSVIAELKKKYNDKFEFSLIEKIPHGKAIESYRNVDILIDQIHAGWYGGLSVELMALGKPVICYLRKKDLNFIPKEMMQELPILNTSPSSLYQTISDVLEMTKEEIEQLGLKSRQFVEKWHCPQKTTKKVLKDMK